MEVWCVVGVKEVVEWLEEYLVKRWRVFRWQVGVGVEAG